MFFTGTGVSRQPKLAAGYFAAAADSSAQARAVWTRVAAMEPVGATGNPEQSGDRMAAQQGADLLKLIEWRRREADPGAFALVLVPHVHQGWNNCGATSCAMFARRQGRIIGSWEFKN